MNILLQNIRPAVGYFELGMYSDAYDELEELAPGLKTSREVLSLKVDILSKLESWELMREVAAFLVKNWPGYSEYWISLGYATRRKLGIPEAKQVLTEAVTHHPEEPILHFNLACYACQLGRLEEAKEKLGVAIALDPEVRNMALDDPDLEPLWQMTGAAGTG